MPTPIHDVRPPLPTDGARARRSLAADAVDGRNTVTPVSQDVQRQLQERSPEQPDASEKTQRRVPGAGLAERNGLITLEDIRPGANDDCSSRITRVCFRGKHFVIYLSDNEEWGDEVRVKYSDDDSIHKKQFKRVSAISDRRYALNHLSRGLRTRLYYLGQIAAAIRLVVDDVPDHKQAGEVLDRAIADVREERGRIGRRIYLLFALLFSGVVSAMLLLASLLLSDVNDALAVLPAAAGSGSVGALLSIAIALRGRTVAPDHDYWTNCTDALLRVTVGTLSGGALILCLTAGLVLDFTVGEVKMVGAGLTESWRAILTFGFIGGFTERMVPDLLEGKAASAQKGLDPQPE